MSYLLLALAWTAYCTLHSAMISETATDILKRRLGESFRFYRLFFNCIAPVTLIPVLWYSHSLRQEASKSAAERRAEPDPARRIARGRRVAGVT